MGDVTLNDLVGYMGDKSGNDNNAIQPTGTKRPTYKNDGTFHWLEFDGTDDYLQTTANIDVSQPEFWLFASGSATSGTTMFGLADTGSEDQALRLDRTQLFVRSEPSQINSITAAITGTAADSVYSIRARQSDRTITIFRGGVQLDQVVAPGSDWFSSPAAMVLGAGKTGANASNYKDYGSLLIIDALSDLQHVAVVDYLTTLMPPWTPSNLFLSSEQGAWYDPSDLTTLFQDSAGTTPVTADGDPVGRMEDKSGNGNHATQAISANRPIYRTDGTLHWLEPDGINDSMLVANKAFNQPEFTAVVGVLGGSANDQRVLDARGTGFIGSVKGWQLKPYRATNSDGFTVDNASTANDIAATATLTTAKVSTATYNPSGNAELRENGVSVVSEAAIGGDIISTEESYLFTNSNGQNAQFFDGKFYGTIVVDKELSQLNIDDSEAYMAGKSGVTL